MLYKKRKIEKKNQQEVKNNVPIELVLNCEANIYFQTMDEYGNETGRLFNNCKVNILDIKQGQFYINPVYNFPENIYLYTPVDPNNKSEQGTINQSGGTNAEIFFADLMKKSKGLDFKLLEPNHKGSDFTVKINGFNCLVQLKTCLQENYSFDPLSENDKKNILDEAKIKKMTPILVNYHPHNNHVKITNLKTNEIIFEENIVVISTTNIFK